MNGSWITGIQSAEMYRMCSEKLRIFGNNAKTIELDIGRFVQRYQAVNFLDDIPSGQAAGRPEYCLDRENHCHKREKEVGARWFRYCVKWWHRHPPL